jgi:hypothetical protein
MARAASTPNWSAKLEYLYMDFGDVTQPNPVDVGESILFDNTVHTVKLGINYKFDWGWAQSAAAAATVTSANMVVRPRAMSRGFSFGES